MHNTGVTFLSGELTLEGVLSLPEGSGPLPGVVVCHPHPLYGGSMDNNVVDAICGALQKAGMVTLKFNFRGVGASEGQFSQGSGEQEDVRAAVAFLSGTDGVDPKRLGLAGYSAGAGYSFPVAVGDARIKAFAGISPPLAMFSFDGLKSWLKPKLLALGTRDDFVPVERFLKFCRGLPEPKEFFTVDGADHFWLGFEDRLGEKVSAFFGKHLRGNA